MSDSNGLQARIRAARERAGLTQAELARRVGLAPNHIARLESGEKSNPRFETVARIAAELGLSLDELSIASGFRGSPSTAKHAGTTVQAANELRTFLSKLEHTRKIAETAVKALDDAAGINRRRRR